MKIEKIPLDRIDIPDVRARSRYTPEQLEFLRGSLSKYGHVSTVLVRPTQNDRFELIDGESRVNELRKLGISEVEATIVELDDRDASMMNLLMNIARGDQDPIGAGVAIKQAMERGMSRKEIATILNYSEEWVEFMAQLLELPEIYQQALREGKLKVTHVREALKLPTPDEVDHALSCALSFSWTTTDIAHYVRNRLTEYEAIEIKQAKTGVAEPVPAPVPEVLVRTQKCMICNRVRDRARIVLPPICDECVEMGRYITTQLGEPLQAMQQIYHAINLYQDFIEYQSRQVPPGVKPSKNEKIVKEGGGDEQKVVSSTLTEGIVPENPVVGRSDVRSFFQRLIRRQAGV